MKKLLFIVPIILVLTGCSTDIDDQKVNNQLSLPNQVKIQVQNPQPKESETKVIQTNEAKENVIHTKKNEFQDSSHEFTKEKTEGFLTYYKGSAVISGKLVTRTYSSGESICLFADAITGKKIPREIDIDERIPWFCFQEQENTSHSVASMFGLEKEKIVQAAEALDKARAEKAGDKYSGNNYYGECELGTATVEISDYISNRMESSVNDTAQLNSVLSKELYKEICR